MLPAVAQLDVSRIREALAGGWTGERGLQRLIERLVSDTRADEGRRIADLIDHRLEKHVVVSELSDAIRNGMA